MRPSSPRRVDVINTDVMAHQSSVLVALLAREEVKRLESALIFGLYRFCAQVFALFQW
jgi:hypothetical protein